MRSDGTRRAVAVRHVGFEDLGGFAPALKRYGFAVRYHDVGMAQSESLESEDPSLLFILGAPIGANEECKYPFLKQEFALIERRLKENKPLFGICLGAQMIARVLGANVRPARSKEIGFAPVRLSKEGHASCLGVFVDVSVLHWHGDNFELPTGAVRLASTDSCENQAFSWGANTIGVQFHPELGNVGFERWHIGHALELSSVGIEIENLREMWEIQRDDFAEVSHLCMRRWITSVKSSIRTSI